MAGNEALAGNEAELLRVEAGKIIFREGDPGDALYVVVEGELSVQSEGPPRVEMARLGAGSFIGEVALMTDQPRSATVTSVNGGAELLRIDRANSTPLSPGIITSRMSRSKLRPPNFARACDAESAVVTRYPSEVRKRDSRSRIRRSSSTTRMWSASSGRLADAVVVIAAYGYDQPA
jgi:hypothetical protein